MSNCRRLLARSSKIFHSQFNFSPGQHTLQSDLAIQNVVNISLIDNSTDCTMLIMCLSSFGITIANTTNFTMKNMIVRNCYRGIDNANILNCTNVNLFYIEADKSICQGIYGLNILGDSHINFIKTSVLYIEYVDLKVVEKHHTLRIQHYHSNQSINTGCSKSFKLSIEMSQSSYIVTVKISELNIRRTGVIQAMFHSNNELLISDCHLIKNSDNRLVLCQVK